MTPPTPSKYNLSKKKAASVVAHAPFYKFPSPAACSLSTTLPLSCPTAIPAIFASARGPSYLPPNMDFGDPDDPVLDIEFDFFRLDSNSITRNADMNGDGSHISTKEHLQRVLGNEWPAHLNHAQLAAFKNRVDNAPALMYTLSEDEWSLYSELVRSIQRQPPPTQNTGSGKRKRRKIYPRPFANLGIDGIVPGPRRPGYHPTLSEVLREERPALFITAVVFLLVLYFTVKYFPYD
ncbi:unnamed protein product [Periconia digitata]|uniref:Uncharacterized protein n=1 Tax=Periconia digitata TaxID=1303443 RepID=A0A9W4XGS6_9PLEO|nr:unnamed protein product [Periconia digitata]